MNRIRNTSQRLVEVLVFYRKKNIKLQPVTPLMPLEALLIPVNPTNSDYDGINGSTGCNFIFFTVPTTCSRPSIEMVGFIIIIIIIIIIIMFSPCSLSWPHCYIFLAQIWHVAPLAPSNDHLRIRFLI